MSRHVELWVPACTEDIPPKRRYLALLRGFGFAPHVEVAPSIMELESKVLLYIAKLEQTNCARLTASFRKMMATYRTEFRNELNRLDEHESVDSIRSRLGGKAAPDVSDTAYGAAKSIIDDHADRARRQELEHAKLGDHG